MRVHASMRPNADSLAQAPGAITKESYLYASIHSSFFASSCLFLSPTSTSNVRRASQT